MLDSKILFPILIASNTANGDPSVSEEEIYNSDKFNKLIKLALGIFPIRTISCELRDKLNTSFEHSPTINK